tara:strand:+ start:11245 stop:11856 length:612 start_codon:yes stop_codon:yes gene_type:complete
MKTLLSSIIIIFFASLNLFSSPFRAYPDDKELEVVSNLDLKRYQGTWFEIAHNPWFVEENCFAMVAFYKLNEEGGIDITNACRKYGYDGEISKVEGQGWVIHQDAPSKLKVQIIWPFTLNYWVIDIGTNYEYAVVGEPDKEKVWILSRQPFLEQEVHSKIIKNLQNQGYDLSKLIWTPQHPAHSQCFANWIETPEPKTNEPVC